MNGSFKLAKLYGVRVAILMMLAGCAMAMSVWAQWPALTICFLVALQLSLFVRIFCLPCPNEREAWINLLIVVSAWISSIGLVTSVIRGQKFFSLDYYHAALAWIITMAIGTAFGISNPSRFNFLVRSFVASWAATASFLLLAEAYLKNQLWTYYFASAVAVFCIAFFVWLFRPGKLLLQVASILALLIISLPIVDLFYQPPLRNSEGIELKEAYYSFEAAKKNPEAFARWWKCYLDEWDAMAKQVFEPIKTGPLPFRLRPGSRGRFFESSIIINSNGFRGREISPDKGNAFRIVALGESTTFGCTLHETDRPWPEMLEELIATKLNPPRPVKVINAGVPAYSLLHNLHRVRNELLQLQPDMIISYHGINGFYLLDAALPKTSGPPPPAFKPRPIRLLADCEYRLRMILHRRRAATGSTLRPLDLSEPLNSPYADAYRELIAFCRSNNIRLVLANYSMALNEQSKPEVVEFYRIGAPSVHWLIRANAAHSALVETLSLEFSDVLFVDTHPQFDGHPEMFIDLGHMTELGRQQIAKNIFAGISNVLHQEFKN